jgi:hypothetical protein
MKEFLFYFTLFYSSRFMMPRNKHEALPNSAIALLWNLQCIKSELKAEDVSAFGRERKCRVLKKVFLLLAELRCSTIPESVQMKKIYYLFDVENIPILRSVGVEPISLWSAPQNAAAVNSIDKELAEVLLLTLRQSVTNSLTNVSAVQEMLPPAPCESTDDIVTESSVHVVVNESADVVMEPVHLGINDEVPTANRPPAIEGNLHEGDDGISNLIHLLDDASGFDSTTCYRMPKFDFKSTLAIWKTNCGVSKRSLDSLLKILNYWRPPVNYSDPDFPRSADKVLGNRMAQRNGGGKKAMYSIRPIKKIVTIKHCKAKRSIESVVGHYVHFGLRSAILGESPGVTSYFQHVRQLREAFIIKPSLFNEELFNATFIRDDRMQDNWPEIVELLKRKSASHRRAVEEPSSKTIVRIDLNIDGVQIVKHTARAPQMTPILARVSALENENERFVFSREMPVFMIGYYHGTMKAPVSEISEELVSELKSNSPVAIGFEHQQKQPQKKKVSPAVRRRRPRKRTLAQIDLAPSTSSNAAAVGTDDEDDDEETISVPAAPEEFDADNEGDDNDEEVIQVLPASSSSYDVDSSTLIRVERIILDAPALKDFTGTTHHCGYNSLPKCLLFGTKKALYEDASGKVLKWSSIHFTSTNCRLRKDEDWKKYADGEVLIINSVICMTAFF